MAETNEVMLYTTRTGRQIPVPSLIVPKDCLTSIMALKERYETKGKSYTLTSLVLDCLARGCDAINRSMDYAEKTTEARKKSDSVQRQIDRTLRAGGKLDLAQILKTAGFAVPTDEAEPPIEELSETELEEATAPETA